MLDAISSSWRIHSPVVLPKLQRSLHHTAMLSKAMQRLISGSQGKHTSLVLQSCHPGSLPA